MDTIVLPVIFVCLVICNNINWGVSGKEIHSYTDVDSIREIDRELQEICFDKTRSIDTYKKIMKADKDFDVCQKSINDFIASEVKKVSKEGNDVDELKIQLKKFCVKSPVFIDCVLKLTSILDLCFDEKEKDIITLLENVTKSVLSFVCYDEGDRIELIFFTGDKDCIINQTKAIGHCLQTSFSKYKPNGKSSLSSLPAFNFREDQCKSMSELQVCVLVELEKCAIPRPTKIPSFQSIIKSFLESVRQSTSCSKFQSVQIHIKSEGYSLHSTISITALCILSILLGRIGFY